VEVELESSSLRGASAPGATGLGLRGLRQQGIRCGHRCHRRYLFSFGLRGTSSGPAVPLPAPAEGAAECSGTAAITSSTRPVSTSTTRVLLGDGGESAGRPLHFFRAFPSAVAVAAEGAPLLPVFFGAARGEVAVSLASASAAASAAAFFSAASRCFANPTRSGGLILKTRILGSSETRSAPRRYLCTPSVRQDRG
jgi:hypothetical protein